MKEAPAPALTRGLAVLDRLVRDGACTLEQLAKTTGWPKSSVLRMLQSLESVGAVAREPTTKRYSALMRLERIGSSAQALRSLSATEMAELCRAVGQTVELHHFDGERLTMIDRCEPETAEVRVRARIGWERKYDEVDALTQIVLAFGIDPANWPRIKYWQWSPNVLPRSVGSRTLRQLVSKVRERGVALDATINSNGVRRYAAPLFNSYGALSGVLAIAQ
jgi:IclR family KDG regulon transcriptional repressor